MTSGRIAGIVFRVALVAACLAWVLSGIDFPSFAAALLRYDLMGCAGVVLVSFAAYAMLGVRLNLFMSERPGCALCTVASVLALGVNNIVPAKLGELVKVMFMHQRTGISRPRLLGVVFWERFFDLNMLALLGMGTSLMLDIKAGVIPLAVLVAGLWIAVALLRLRPGVAQRIVSMMPLARVREVLDSVSVQVRIGFAVRPLGVLACGTLGVWVLYAGQAVLALLWAAGFGLSPDQALMVFVVSALGMSVPAAPGGLGVFEAAVVLALGWFGVNKSEALAGAVFMRLVQYIPTTLFALAVLAHTGVSLRRAAEEI